MVSRTECNAINASLLLNLINNNFLIFLTENLPILNHYLPPNPKICDPILVTLLKMRSHYSHLCRENATPSNGTSPLAYCKGVPPPPGFRRSTTVFVFSLTCNTGSKVAIVTKCLFCLYSQAQQLSEAFSRLLLLASSMLCKLNLTRFLMKRKTFLEKFTECGISAANLRLRPESMAESGPPPHTALNRIDLLNF